MSYGVLNSRGFDGETFEDPYVKESKMKRTLMGMRRDDCGRDPNLRKKGREEVAKCR
jgi:hypothetical protein